MSSLRTRLQEALDHAGLSQAELARRSGQSKQAINLIATGVTKRPSGEMLVAIARELWVDPDSLLHGPLRYLRRNAGSAKARGSAIAHARDALPFSDRPVTVIGTASLDKEGRWTEIQRTTAGRGKRYVVMHNTRDPQAYAVRLRGDGGRPRYEPGECVVVSPNAAIEPDRDVLVTLKTGEQMLRKFGARRDGMLVLHHVSGTSGPITLDEGDVASVHRVVGRADEIIEEEE
jgi:transcriptional regulator with XRE-family HTH domain